MIVNTHSAGSRLDVIDALRGFALAGIVVAHVVEQFIAAPRPSPDWWVPASLLDNVLLSLQFILVAGKFYSMFALLFGMSFAIMMSNAEQKGQYFGGRFVWRLVLLMALGFLHSLVYRGDILGVYAVIGLLLPMFYRMPGKWLWLIALVLFAGAGRFVFFAITGSSTLLSWQQLPDEPEVLRYVNLLKEGSFWQVAGDNLGYIFTGKFDFQFGIFGRGYFTLGYFLVGLWLIRSGVVYRLQENTRLLKRCLWISLAVTLLVMVLSMTAFSQLAQPVDYNTWGFVLSWNIADLGNISLTVFFVCGFVLLFLRRPRGWLRLFCAYGRMALTAYITQSLLGTFFFYGWGMGLLGELKVWQTLLLSLLLIAGQMWLCNLWLKHFHYGPLEWAWRCATWFKPFRFHRLSAAQV